MRDVLGRIWKVLGRIADVIRVIIVTAFCALFIVALWWDATTIASIYRIQLSVLAIGVVVFVWRWAWQRMIKDHKGPDDNPITTEGLTTGKGKADNFGRRIKYSVILVIIVANILLIFLRIQRLSCTRVESGIVSCTHSQRFFGLNLGGAKVIDGLVAAEVTAHANDYASGYRVVLQTASGKNHRLTESFSSGAGHKERAANEINRYLSDQEQKTLELDYGIDPTNLIFAVILSSIFIWLLVALWRQPES